VNGSSRDDDRQWTAREHEIAIRMRETAPASNPRMGLNTWAAFAGSDQDAMIAGDVAMLEPELTPVLTALRKHGLDVVAIHHHMTGVQPTVVFLHYFGTGEAAAPARGVPAALDELGTLGMAPTGETATISGT
jgi:hypothetical protein